VKTPHYNWHKLKLEWIQGGHRTLADFAAAVKVPHSTVRKRAAREHWIQKGMEAQQKSAERAEQKFIEAAADKIARAKLKHVNLGNMLQAKGVRSFEQIDMLDGTQAITAIRAGVDIERKGLGLDEREQQPGGTTNNVQNNFTVEVKNLAVIDAGARQLIVERLRKAVQS
jgi:hypothetical protein